MKKAIINAKKITIVLMIIFTITFSQTGFAFKNENPVELRFVENIKDHPLFQLRMHNTEEEEFLIKVKDGSGNVLYSETLKGINISRRYLLDIDQEDMYDIGFNLRFEVTRIKNNETQVYNVTRNTQVVQNILVAKL